jgi:citrate synthase
MSMLRTGVSASSAFDPDGWDDSPEAEYRKAMRLIAEVPTMIATYHRFRTGQETIPPNPDLNHAANLLWMLHGEEPDPADADVLDTTFVLYADHTMNASTFAARVVASTLSDMFSAISAAIGALKGPLHGGANEEAMKLAEEVGKPENAQAAVRDRLERHEKIMGFGHAVYRTMDPRALVLKELCRAVGERHDQPQWYEIFAALEATTFEQKGLYPNVDLYAAGVYHILGIPTDLMTPLFALARMAGWTAHVREQYANNRIIRPGSEYVGPSDRTYVPIDER